MNNVGHIHLPAHANRIKYKVLFWGEPGGLSSWRRHQLETFFTLLAICVGKSPVMVNSLHKDQGRGPFMFSLICTWINSGINNRESGDLRRHRANYDVTVLPPIIVITWQISLPVCCSGSIQMALPLTHHYLKQLWYPRQTLICVSRPQWVKPLCCLGPNILGAVSIRKTVLPGMAIPMLKIRRPNGRLIFNMEIAIRR